MPRARGNASAAAEPVEPENSVGSDEKVDLDEDDDPEEMDEEVEYEEVEEVEEIEEEELVEVEEEEEVEEEDEENANSSDESSAQKRVIGDDTNVGNEDERKIHAELLSRPPHGSEVYIGGIPPDASEDDLKGFCESIGEVTEVRIMKGKDSNENKRFAFVTFRNVDLASKAIDDLNNAEFKGRKIKCSTAQAKYRLFLANIPKSWEDEDLRKVVAKVGPGITALQLVKDMKTNNNKGFAFIDYYNTACAEYARQRMGNSDFKLGDNTPAVSWAEPKNADSSSASQVKAIYVKNLPKNVTQDQLKKLFEHHGKILKIVLPPAKPGQERNRIGFVHFAERSSAMKALRNTEKYELDGQVVECSLAKPQTDQKSLGVPNLQNSGLLTTYPPVSGYGMLGGAFGALGAGYGAVAQPMIYGRGPSPAGMAMMPMLLPDGRIGYVLQQPGVQLHSPPSHHKSDSRHSSGGSSRSGGSSGRGSRQGNDSSNGRRYRPY
ncbi:heterogeneous nuclear ribonucleoprotein Q-like [Mercurialis annua]|uniref:heterogeneous nuclear ribonucleoprotein Q-like n=1 Tax=Mercurialis annua TaxID=3986 RepID=UPI00215FDD64|nr:heterogeneous nuclear ribonucleoprotein Q-like [Mercurialis annua]XP_050209344.1 heterogeneous nuclear ribonucleoprotein Q-like [Mercurialis annua]XP_050209350.1 heterogeneous nuclear ribonucleoprotein Q-like [Mercurialis annua]XP_050209358.1 heterogeneous nuclear ribonucleoprotein Q-like [Mercurialis annua]